MPKNVLLLHTDQQRADTLGCYGNACAQTPNLDKLAREGVTFRHHYTSNPVCMPSRASLFTGRCLPAHGVIDNGIPLDPRVDTLPAAFARAGFDTFAAGKLHLTPYQSPAHFQHPESLAAWENGCFANWDGPYYGFQHVRLVLGHGESTAHPARAHYGQWLSTHHPGTFNAKGNASSTPPIYPGTYPSRIPSESHYTTYVANQIIQFLETRDSGQPFFVFAGFSDPHAPFTPPAEWAARFENTQIPPYPTLWDEYELRPEFYNAILSGNCFPKDGGAQRAPEGEPLQAILRNTFAMIAFIDDAIGRILQTLTRLGLDQDTIVAFTSDHGDFLGEHGLLYKAQLPFASLMRVPFILRAPGITPATTHAPMGNIDVMPTLLDLAGVPIPQTLQGRSYRPLLTGEQNRIHEFTLSCGWSKESPNYRHISLHNDTWRLTWWPGINDGELYDLRADPHEFDNVFHADEYLAERGWLMEQLLTAYAQAGPLEPHTLCDW